MSASRKIVDRVDEAHPRDPAWVLRCRRGRAIAFRARSSPGSKGAESRTAPIEQSGARRCAPLLLVAVTVRTSSTETPGNPACIRQIRSAALDQLRAHIAASVDLDSRMGRCKGGPSFHGVEHDPGPRVSAHDSGAILDAVQVSTRVKCDNHDPNLAAMRRRRRGRVHPYGDRARRSAGTAPTRIGVA